MLNEIEELQNEVKLQGEQINELKREINRMKSDFDFLSRLMKSYKSGINRDAISFEMENFSGLGVNREKRSMNLIVSLTSFRGRLYDVPYAIYSLMCQSLKPDKIILWLNEKDFPNEDESLPISIRKMIKNGLTIRYCEDKRSYTKLIHALEEYPDDIIITADDDIYYPVDWLEKLFKAHLKFPDQIISHRIHKVKIEAGKIASYTTWKKNLKYTEASVLNFLTGVGGVLYPPHSLYKDVLKNEIYEKYVPMADDIWFWAMAVLNGRKIANMPDCYNRLKFVNAIREYRLNDEQVLAKQNVDEDYNTMQLNALIEVYPELLQRCLEAQKEERI